MAERTALDIESEVGLYCEVTVAQLKVSMAMGRRGRCRLEAILPPRLPNRMPNRMLNWLLNWLPDSWAWSNILHCLGTSTVGVFGKWRCYCLIYQAWFLRQSQNTEHVSLISLIRELCVRLEFPPSQQSIEPDFPLYWPTEYPSALCQLLDSAFKIYKSWLESRAVTFNLVSILN